MAGRCPCRWLHPAHRGRGPTLSSDRRAKPEAMQTGVMSEYGGMTSMRFPTRREPRGRAAAIVLDESQVDTVGKGAKRFPVVATVNHFTWRTSVARMVQGSS
jgi:hypothetical protein